MSTTVDKLILYAAVLIVAALLAEAILYVYIRWTRRK